MSYKWRRWGGWGLEDDEAAGKVVEWGDLAREALRVYPLVCYKLALMDKNVKMPFSFVNLTTILLKIFSNASICK